MTKYREDFTKEEYWAEEDKARRLDHAEGVWQARKMVRAMKREGILRYEGGIAFVYEVRDTLGEMMESNLSPQQMGWVGSGGQP